MRSHAANPEGESALGCLAALLAPHRSLRTCSSLAPCHPPQNALARRGWVSQQAPKARPGFRRWRIVSWRRRSSCALEMDAQGKQNRSRSQDQ
jgi:hypothetical protein